jgi:hypothetical protein|eukprot:COSAG01_NODE_4982_length_4570_cov_5.535003_5_plen_86_part_00
MWLGVADGWLEWAAEAAGRDPGGGRGAGLERRLDAGAGETDRQPDGRTGARALSDQQRLAPPLPLTTYTHTPPPRRGAPFGLVVA